MASYELYKLHFLFVSSLFQLLPSVENQCHASPKFSLTKSFKHTKVKIKTPESTSISTFAPKIAGAKNAFKRNRTADLLLTRQTLCQLSHEGEYGCQILACKRRRSANCSPRT
ncbi:hypothetical protein, partial, partial [Absidia glauca]